MARQDAGKWVARAGATGGGRTYRAKVPYRWYSGLALIVLLGVFLVVYSRYERLHPTTVAAAAPTTSDHWVAGLVFDICGNAQQTLPSSPVDDSLSLGLYSSGSGVIQIQPKSSADTGLNANLGRFASQYPGLKFTATSLGLPKKRVYTDGERCPSGTPDAGKTGELVATTWPEPSSTSPTTTTGNLLSLHFAQTLQLVSVGFLPSGSTAPHPDGTVVTAVLNAGTAAAQSSTSTTLPVITTTTKPGTTTTTAKGTTSTTAAKGTTSTTAAKGTSTTTTG
jgi:hypothetical protein